MRAVSHSLLAPALAVGLAVGLAGCLGQRGGLGEEDAGRDAGPPPMDAGEDAGMCVGSSPQVCNSAGTALVGCVEGRPETTPCERGCEPEATSCLGCAEGSARCEGGDLLTCAGGVEGRAACALGCLSAPTAHCAAMIPSNVGEAVPFDAEGAELIVPTGQLLLFDTDTGEIRAYAGETFVGTLRAGGTGVQNEILFETLNQASPAPELALWSFASVSVQTGGTLQLVGGRAAVLLVAGDVTVSGNIFARSERTVISPGPFRGPAAGRGGAAGTVNGPGAGPGGRGGEAGYEGTINAGKRIGAAGGSFGSRGGQGGSPTVWNPAEGIPQPNAVYGNAQLVPLYGGSGGGSGEDDASAGGDGGGALQISARGNLTVLLGGRIDAGGQAGLGATADTRIGSGGGGGSGGGVLLEASAITLIGIVGAPGGGGGGGSGGGAGASHGDNGARWSPPGDTLGDGGRGGTGETNGGHGGDGSDVAGGEGGNGWDDGPYNGGGGGGGAGRLRFNTLPGGLDRERGTLSPNFAGMSGLATTGEIELR